MFDLIMSCDSLFQISFVFLHHWIFYTCTQFAAYSKALEDAIAALDEVAFEIDVTDRKFHFCSCLCKGYIRTVQPNTLTSPWGLTDWFIWTWLLPDTWVPLYRSDDVEYCAKLHWYKVYKSFWNSYCGKIVVFRWFSSFLLAFSTMINKLEQFLFFCTLFIC